MTQEELNETIKLNSSRTNPTNIAADRVLMAAFDFAITIHKHKGEWEPRTAELEILLRTVDDWLMSIPTFHCSPEHAPPIAVRRAMMRKFRKPDDIRHYIQLLRYHGPYWGFTYASMFHGVEPDGYIHT